jgi:hypothetical protein
MTEIKDVHDLPNRLKEMTRKKRVNQGNHAPITENGRPVKPIDWRKVDDLLLAGCTGAEVAAFFDMHPQTFYDRAAAQYGTSFTAYSQSKKQNGEAILRAHQYAKALGMTKEGDNTLLIWLGKQRLNQSETPHDSTVSPELISAYSTLMQEIKKQQDLAKGGNETSH